MTDVEMKEASTGASKTKAKAPEGSSDGKKKFEVKKVCPWLDAYKRYTMGLIRCMFN